MCKWKDEIIGDEAYRTLRKRSQTSADEVPDALRSERNRLRQEIQLMQMEHDTLKKVDEILKKGPGISALTNREKTKVAHALREASTSGAADNPRTCPQQLFLSPPDASYRR